MGIYLLLAVCLVPVIWLAEWMYKRELQKNAKIKDARGLYEANPQERHRDAVELRWATIIRNIAIAALLATGVAATGFQFVEEARMNSVEEAYVAGYEQGWTLGCTVVSNNSFKDREFLYTQCVALNPGSGALLEASDLIRYRISSASDEEARDLGQYYGMTTVYERYDYDY